jgi:hypothetical protein
MYNRNHFEYKLVRFDYILEIKDYEFEVEDRIITLTAECVQNCPRIPKELDPDYPIYGIEIINSGSNTAYVHITEKVLDLNLFNNFEDYEEDTITELELPNRLWSHVVPDIPGRVHGVGTTPEFIFFGSISQNSLNELYYEQNFGKWPILSFSLPMLCRETIPTHMRGNFEDYDRSEDYSDTTYDIKIKNLQQQWLEFLPNYRNEIGQNITNFLTEHEFSEDIKTEFVNLVANRYMKHYEENTFFCSKNLYLLLKNQYKRGIPYSTHPNITHYAAYPYTDPRKVITAIYLESMCLNCRKFDLEMVAVNFLNSRWYPSYVPPYDYGRGDYETVNNRFWNNNVYPIQTYLRTAYYDTNHSFYNFMSEVVSKTITGKSLNLTDMEKVIGLSWQSVQGNLNGPYSINLDAFINYRDQGVN